LPVYRLPFPIRRWPAEIATTRQAEEIGELVPDIKMSPAYVTFDCYGTRDHTESTQRDKEKQ